MEQPTDQDAESLKLVGPTMNKHQHYSVWPDRRSRHVFCHVEEPNVSNLFFLISSEADTSRSPRVSILIFRSDTICAVFYHPLGYKTIRKNF